MHGRERPATLVPQRVPRGPVHLRRSPIRDERDEVGDESWFLVVAVVAGAVLGYLVALG